MRSLLALRRVLRHAPRRADGAGLVRREPARSAGDGVPKRLYRGTIDLPKSNKVRVIALTPPARDALLSLPEQDMPVAL